MGHHKKSEQQKFDQAERYVKSNYTRLLTTVFLSKADKSKIAQLDELVKHGSINGKAWFGWRNTVSDLTSAMEQNKRSGEVQDKELASERAADEQQNQPRSHFFGHHLEHAPESPAAKEKLTDAERAAIGKDLLSQIDGLLSELDLSNQQHRDWQSGLVKIRNLLANSKIPSETLLESAGASVTKIEDKFTGRFQQKQQEKNAQLREAIGGLAGEIGRIVSEIEERLVNAASFAEANDLRYFDGNFSVLKRQVDAAKNVDEVARLRKTFERLGSQYKEAKQILQSKQGAVIESGGAPAANRGVPPVEKPEEGKLGKIISDNREFEESGFLRKNAFEIIEIAKKLRNAPSLDNEDKEWLAKFLDNQPGFQLRVDGFVRRKRIWKIAVKAGEGQAEAEAAPGAQRQQPTIEEKGLEFAGTNGGRSMRPEGALEWIDRLKAAIEALDINKTSQQDDLTTGAVHGKLSDLASDIRDGTAGTTKKITRRFLELEALALPVLQRHGIAYETFLQRLEPMRHGSAEVTKGQTTTNEELFKIVGGIRIAAGKLKGTIDGLPFNTTVSEDNAALKAKAMLQNLDYDIGTGHGDLSPESLVKRLAAAEALVIPIFERFGIDYAPFAAQASSEIPAITALDLKYAAAKLLGAVTRADYIGGVIDDDMAFDSARPELERLADAMVSMSQPAAEGDVKRFLELEADLKGRFRLYGVTYTPGFGT
ncbi:MAG: hypothetical protein WC717_05645 [Candidatus Micrarchaeia archaeon]